MVAMHMLIARVQQNRVPLLKARTSMLLRGRLHRTNPKPPDSESKAMRWSESYRAYLLDSRPTERITDIERVVDLANCDRESSISVRTTDCAIIQRARRVSDGDCNDPYRFP